MKVVFLDFDGVVNNPGCYAIASGERTPADPKAIEALNWLTESSGAYIVVSSSWRHGKGGLMRCREHLAAWGSTAIVIDVTPRLYDKARGAEIAEWLDRRARHPVESFVILDDDNDMEPHMDRLVQTKGHVGLTMADAEHALAMISVNID